MEERSFFRIPAGGGNLLTIEAEPEAISLDPQRTALIVVDMQNDFCSPGGKNDLMGKDFNKGRSLIPALQKLLQVSRSAGIKVIYLAATYRQGLANSGGPHSPSWHKVIGLRNPEIRGKVAIEDTWFTEIIEELKPLPEEVVVKKSRYSGFYQTDLELILKTYQSKYLLFSGLSTHNCVEATLRDAFYRDFWPILIKDACVSTSGDFLHEGTAFIVERQYGWVTRVDDVLEMLK